MKDQFNRYSKGLKRRIVGTKYGETWQKQDEEFYDKLWEQTPLVHQDFKKWISSIGDIKTVLEVGCGSGVYPIKNKQLFKNLDYTGIDISKSAIAYCKKHSDFTFYCDDFIKMDLDKKYDLVFSHSVVDHVYDVNTFLKKIVNSTKKYSYIVAYRGYFPDIEDHNMEFAKFQGCYHNELSINKIKIIFKEAGLTEKEFVVEQIKTGYDEKPIGTLIKINKS